MTVKSTFMVLSLAAVVLGLAMTPRVLKALPAQGSAQQGSQAPSKHTSKHKRAHGLTLEQAVARVQNQTGGKVLKADSRNLGRFTEYRIKVLTPEGHVRVVTIRSDGHGD